MKKQLKAAVLAILIIAGATGCSMIDSFFGEEDIPENIEPDREDSRGNLVIINETSRELALYSSAGLEKVLPAVSDSFLVEVSVTGDTESVELILYYLSDVAGSIHNPDPDYIFRKWMPILSSDMEFESRATWRVDLSETEPESGTLIFEYTPENSTYYVDVYLDSTTGAKIAELRSGQTNKQVGLDYGNYRILYRFWMSNPYDDQGSEEIGWIEKTVINGEEANIEVVLKETRSELWMSIPTYGTGEPAELYGTVRITNPTAKTANIWIGSRKIEQIMYSEDPTTNMSAISANDFESYLIPAGEYTLTAKDNAGNILGQTTVLVEAVEETVWDIE